MHCARGLSASFEAWGHGVDVRNRPADVSQQLACLHLELHPGIGVGSHTIFPCLFVAILRRWSGEVSLDLV